MPVPARGLVNSFDSLVTYSRIHEQEKANKISWWNQTRLVVVVEGADKQHLEYRQLYWSEIFFKLFSENGSSSRNEINKFCAKKLKIDKDLVFNFIAETLISKKGAQPVETSDTSNQNLSATSENLEKRIEQLEFKDTDKKIIRDFFRTLALSPIVTDVQLNEMLRLLPKNCQQCGFFKTGMVSLINNDKFDLIEKILTALSLKNEDNIHLLKLILQLLPEAQMTKEKILSLIPEELMGKILTAAIGSQFPRAMSAAILVLGAKKFKEHILTLENTSNDFTNWKALLRMLSGHEGFTQKQIFLLHAGLFARVARKHRFEAMSIAIEIKNKDLFGDLISYYPKPPFEALLAEASKSDDPYYFNRLVEQFDIKKEQISNMKMPFYSAIIAGSACLVDKLMNNYVDDVNAPLDEAGNTPLIIALTTAPHGPNKLVILNRLALYSADIDKQNNQGTTPLMLTVEHRDIDLFKWVLEQGPNPLMKNRDDQTVRDIIRTHNLKDFKRALDEHLSNTL